MGLNGLDGVVDTKLQTSEIGGTQGSSFSDHRTIDTHMLHLRQKIENDPKTPVHLRTAHGKGYILDLGDGE